MHTKTSIHTVREASEIVMSRRKHLRYKAETVFAAISIEDDEKGIYGDPVVLIDVSDGGLSFLSSQQIPEQRLANVVLVGYGLISGYVPVIVERTQKLRKNLFRYGASVHATGIERRYYEAIVANCARKGGSIALWK